MGALEAEQLRLFDCGSVDLERLRLARLRLSRKPRAERTLTAYASDFGIYERWCHEAGRSSVPATPDTVSLYVTWQLAERGLKTSTAERHVSSICHFHREAGNPKLDVTEARHIIAAVRRERLERPEGKNAFTPADIKAMARACNTRTARGLRDRALIVLGFATGIRGANIGDLNLADVRFDRRGVIVGVRKEKNDQAGKGRSIAVWPGKRASTDPVRVTKAWLNRRGNWAGPLFPRIQIGDTIMRDRMSQEAISEIVKRAAASAGLDPSLYSSHSLRAGAATTAAEIGCSDNEIMNLTGHRSADQMRSYVRRGRLFSGRNPLAGAL